MLKIIKKYKIILLIALLVNVAVLPFGLTFTDKQITLPGGLTEVKNVIKIDSNDTDSGSFSSIFVVSPDFSTKLEVFLIDKFYDKGQVTEQSTYTSYFTLSENMERSKIQKDYSVQTSLIVAYLNAQENGLDVSIDYKLTGAIVSWYSKDTKSYEIGDLFISVDGVSVDSPKEFVDAFNSRSVGSTYQIKRNGNIVYGVFDENNINAMSLYRYYDINSKASKPSFEILPSNVSGPSGGLLQTLSLYNQLTSTDLTKNKKISGTGTININGEVGPIGGIKQKIYTADKNNVDIFFCPKDNYDDAKGAYDSLSISRQRHMKLVVISSFKEALDYLEKN